MPSSTFDTLAATRALEAAGVERAQAEAHAEQLRAAAGGAPSRLATKADLAPIRAEMTMFKWAMTFQAVLIVAMAARLFGIL